MVKARTWFTLFIMSLATVAATASCGSDEATGGGGGVGGGLLNGGAGGKAGSVGRAGSGGSSTMGTSTLGATCTADAECGDGMICATTSGNVFNGGGPANGLCTMACMTDADCTAIETGAGCFNFGTQAAPKPYCLQGCTQGGTDQATADTKCQRRADVACTDLRNASTTTTPEPFCLPLCRSDLECGAGLFCNKSSGLCTKTKGTGDPVGTPCTPGAGATNTCEGFCIRTTATGVMPVKGICAEFCAGFLDCAYTGATPGGLCAGQLSNTFGLLDLGYCLPNCSCSGECPFPGDVCRAWAATEASFSQDLGAPGLCYPNATGSSALKDCAGGGAGGATGAAGDTSISVGVGGASGAGN